MKNLLVVANALLTFMFVFAIANALMHHGFGGDREALYYLSTVFALLVLATNIFVLVRGK